MIVAEQNEIHMKSAPTGNAAVMQPGGIYNCKLEEYCSTQRSRIHQISVRALSLAITGQPGSWHQLQFADSLLVDHLMVEKHGVMLDAQPNLEHAMPGIEVDAAERRSVPNGMTLVRKRARAHTLPGTLVFGLGTNDEISARDLDELVQLTTGHALVVVTAHCPYCDWVVPSNQRLRRACTPQRHCFLADFDVVAARNPKWFPGDGVHMVIGGVGADGYAAVVAAAVHAAATPG